MTSVPTAHPPETIEGWYALHQIFRATGVKPTAASVKALARRVKATSKSKKAPGSNSGWSCLVRLIGSTSDFMAIHFRESLDALGEVQRALAGSDLELTYSFLSVTEAGLYHITAELARAAVARGGAVGDAEYATALAARAEAERESAHVTRRLYPDLPAQMPYVCFYPMSKRRDPGQNWYTLSLDERSRLMQAHGITGRRYAGKVQQVISGAIGLDTWEWGVTLFARDPLDFKKLVTDMRFDEVSAKYAEFGDFYVGRLID
ncbi:MAG TPA: chlorite dismutase family protein [Gemmatimonadaceae bacterium]